MFKTNGMNIQILKKKKTTKNNRKFFQKWDENKTTQKKLSNGLDNTG